MSIILLIFALLCAFAAGVEYESRNTLEFSPEALGGLLFCAIALGLIVIGILSPEALHID
jgi:hypothetical protein